jgi:hypothetical protein
MTKKRILRIAKWFTGIILGLVLLITVVLFIFKDDICALVIDEVNKSLKVPVSVSDVDLAFWGSFPHLSVDFKNVFIQDSFEGSTKLDTLLYSKRIRMKFNPMDLWRENYTLKSVEISPGTLKLKVNSQGITNFDILAERKDSLENTELAVKLEEVDFEEFRFSYSNQVIDQKYAINIHSMSLVGEFSSSKFTTSATSDLHIIAARSGKINLVSNKPAKLNITVNVDKEAGTIQIPQSTIYISELPFTFKGNIAEKEFQFSLKGKNIKIEDAANRLAMKETENVKNFGGSGTLLFDLEINGDDNAKQSVTVDCIFGITNGNLKEPTSGITVSSLNLEGIYSNRGGSEKEKLELKNIAFTTSGGPFKGNLKLTQFANPVFEGNADGTINLEVLHALFQLPSIQTLTGSIDVHSDFLIKGNTDENQVVHYDIQKLDGQIILKDVDLQLIDDKRVFENIAGRVYLNGDEAGVDNVKLRVKRSDFTFNGLFSNLAAYISSQGNLTADVSINSNLIYLEDLGTESKEEIVLRERAYILPNDITGNMFVEIGSLKYDEHTFKEITGNMSVDKRKIHFSKIAIKTGGADVYGSLTIEEKTPEIFHVSSQIVSDNINFTKLFKEWDDFKQTVIKSSNIEGEAKASLNFEAPFDLRSGVISNAIVANIGIQIDNGRLKNLETFNTIISSLKSSSLRAVIGKDNIDAFGSKLNDLKFDQLKNTLIIKNSVLTIPQMSISSSALDVELSGKHSFDNKVDYRFGFRFKDLKKEKTSEFGEIIDDGTGFRVYMRMYGNIDNPTIEWDKQSRKETTKENITKEKEDVKSLLKSEFGLFKNDSTVKQYVKEKNPPKEEMIIEFDPDNSVEPVIEEKQPKKDSKINRILDKMKKESEAEKKEKFEIEFQ